MHHIIVFFVNTNKAVWTNLALKIGITSVGRAGWRHSFDCCVCYKVMWPCILKRQSRRWLFILQAAKSRLGTLPLPLTLYTWHSAPPPPNTSLFTLPTPHPSLCTMLINIWTVNDCNVHGGGRKEFEIVIRLLVTSLGWVLCQQK